MMNLVMIIFVVLALTFVMIAKANDELDNLTDGNFSKPVEGANIGTISAVAPAALRNGNSEEGSNGTLEVNEVFHFDLDALRKRLDKDIKVTEHQFDATPIVDRDEVLNIERNAKPMVIVDNSNATHERDLSSCVPFETLNRDPGDAITYVWGPWSEENRKTCKMFVKWSDGTSGACSASLIGPNHILTAAQCTMDGCRNNDDIFAIQSYVACGYGYKDLVQDPAQLGRAYIRQCSHYPEFENNLKCVNGQSSGPLEWDIQICQIDRSLLHSHGHYGVSYEPHSNMNVRGYPEDRDLDPYVRGRANLAQFWRSATSQAWSSKQYFLGGTWAFSGEAGAPYYVTARVIEPPYIKSSVIGVHNGGITGCYALGRRIDTSFMNIIQDKLINWAVPTPWCNVIEDTINLNGAHSRPFKEISSDRPPTVFSLEVYPGEIFTAKFPLMNAGNKHSGTVTIRYFAKPLEEGTPIYMGKRYVDIDAWSTKMITTEFTALETLRLTPSGFYKIIGRWSDSCLDSPDPKEVNVSWLVAQKLPYGNRCTSDDDCESDNCHNGSCCHENENTRRCEACHAATGLCVQCEGYYAPPGCSGCLNTAYRPLLTTNCVEKKFLGDSCNLVSRNYGNSQCKSGYCERNGPLSLRGTCATE